MNETKYRGVLVLLAIFGTMALLAAGPISAMPGWSKSGHPSITINPEQREQIARLHSAYRAALAELDWSLGENGHAPETMRQAQVLRMALRAEISDVLRRDHESTGSNESGVCPYSGRKTPVKFDRNAPTLYL